MNTYDIFLDIGTGQTQISEFNPADENPDMQMTCEDLIKRLVQFAPSGFTFSVVSRERGN